MEAQVDNGTYDGAKEASQQHNLNFRNRFRFTSCLPFALAIIAFSLTLVLAVAGTKPGQLTDKYMISLNTSKIGQDIIQFSPANTTSTDPSTTDPTDPLSYLTGVWQGIIQNITSTIDGGIEARENDIVLDVKKALGIADFYDLYIQKVCEGNYTSPDTTRCVSYSAQSAGLNSIINSPATSLTLGTTNISVPILAQVTSSFNTISSQFNTALKAIFAFFVISLIGSGLTALGSILAFFNARSRLWVYFSLAFASLGAFFQFVASVALTALVEIVAGTVGQIGNAVNLRIKEGRQAIVFTWLSTAFLIVASWYWFAMWFVEVRDWAFKRRRRTALQMGNWRGVVGELVDDMRIKGD